MQLRSGGAFVDILPRLSKGFEAAVQQEVDGPLSRVGQRASKLGGTLTKSLTLPILGAAAAMGGGLVAAGQQLDKALDNIAIKTGATGERLESLSGSFRNVAKTVPNDMAQVSDAVSELHARTGLTGPGLEDLATRMLTLSRITGSDLNASIEQSTRLFGDWSIQTGQQGESLDFLLAVSQKTGTGIGQLQERLVQFGAPLRQLGFSMEESASLLAKFEKEGVNTELVMGSMRVALGKMARAGEEPVETFRRVTSEIAAAGDAGKANALALDLFGARAGPDMAAAIREGRFELGSFIDDLGDTDGAIGRTSAQTDGWNETWGRLKNSIVLAVEPLATKLFAALDKLVPKLAPVVDGIVKLIDAFMGLDPQLQIVIAGTIAAVAAAGPLLVVIGALASPVGLVALALGGLAAALITAYKRSETFRDVVDKVLSWLKGDGIALVRQFADYITDRFDDLRRWIDKIMPAIKEAIGHVLTVITFLWDAFGDDLMRIASAAFDTLRTIVESGIRLVKSVIETVLALINGDWGKAWDGIKGILSAVWDAMKALVQLQLDLVKGIIGGALSVLEGLWSAAWGKLGELLGAAWDGIKDVLRGGVRFLLDMVLLLAEKVFDGAAVAFGWVPGLGPKLKQAAKDVERFRDDVNEALSGIKDKKVTVTADLAMSSAFQEHRRRERQGDGEGIEPSRSLGSGFRSAIAYLQSTGIPHQVTSTLRPGARTVGGNLSLHAIGKAVDFAGPNMMSIARAFLPVAGSLKELIHTPMGFGIKNGQRVPLSAFGPKVNAMHYNHVHVGTYEDGGLVRHRSFVVGEDGPELLNTGMRAHVTSRPNLEAMLAGAMDGKAPSGRSGPLVNIEHAVFDDEVDIDMLGRRLDFVARPGGF